MSEYLSPERRAYISLLQQGVGSIEAYSRAFGVSMSEAEKLHGAELERAREYALNKANGENKNLASQAQNEMIRGSLEIDPVELARVTYENLYWILKADKVEIIRKLPLGATREQFATLTKEEACAIEAIDFDVDSGQIKKIKFESRTKAAGLMKDILTLTEVRRVQRAVGEEHVSGDVKVLEIEGMDASDV